MINLAKLIIFLTQKLRKKNKRNMAELWFTVPNKDHRESALWFGRVELPPEVRIYPLTHRGRSNFGPSCRRFSFVEKLAFPDGRKFSKIIIYERPFSRARIRKYTPDRTEAIFFFSPGTKVV